MVYSALKPAGTLARVLLNSLSGLVGQRKTDGVGDFLVEVGNQAGGARQNRHAFERVHRKTHVQQHGRNAGRDIELELACRPRCLESRPSMALAMFDVILLTAAGFERDIEQGVPTRGSRSLCSGWP